MIVVESLEELQRKLQFYRAQLHDLEQGAKPWNMIWLHRIQETEDAIAIFHIDEAERIIKGKKPKEITLEGTLDLFGDVLEQATNTSTGEVVLPPPPSDLTKELQQTPALAPDLKERPFAAEFTDFLNDPERLSDAESQAREERMHELRMEMGYHAREPLTIQTAAQAEKALEIRWEVMAKLANLKQYVERKTQEYLSSLETWEKDWQPLLEEWDKANPAKKGKTSLECEFGSLKRANQAGGYSVSDNDKPLLDAWLKQQYEANSVEAKTKFGIEMVPTFNRNLDLIKAHMEKTKTIVPGMKYREPKVNEFRVGPSFDTFQTNFKKGKI